MRSNIRGSFLVSAAGALALAAGLASAQGGCPVDCPQQSRITICYEGGRADSYAAPFDSTSRRPFFDAFVTSTYAGIIKQFDDTTENRVLGHTFQNLPCGIVAATLEVEMRAGNTIPQNDAIYLQYTGGTSFAWGSPIASLPGAGGTWNPAQTQTFLLNLASLPGGGNLLPAMNTSHALDFLMQDDTTVEHMRLTITVCPCDGKYRTYTVGTVDNMAPPTEPTSRRARLTALRTLPPFLWKDNDDCTIDRGWGNTFTNIVPGVVRADFTIRMKPCAGGANNDGMGFDLINDGGPELFSRNFNINLLPGSGGSWISNPLTNFTFNLGATVPSTVCGTNLLGDFGDRTFDVYVQDDTGVDAARLRVQPCPPLRHIFGIPVRVLGSAELSFDAATRSWSALHIGGTGLDGDIVEFDVHQAPGSVFLTDPSSMDEWEPGSDMTVRLGGGDVDGDGLPDVLAGVHMVKRQAQGTSGSAMECSIDPAGSYSGFFTVTVSDQAAGTRTTIPISMGTTVTIASTHMEEWAWSSSRECRSCGWDLKMGTKLRERAPVMVGPVMLEGDSIEFAGWSGPECGDGDCPAPVEVCSWSWGASNPRRMSFTGAGVSSTGTSEPAELGDFIVCYAIAPDPDCSLESNPGGLTIGNIGGTGNDGVEIHVPPADEWAAAMGVICAGLPENCPTEPVQLSMDFRASLGGQPDHHGGASNVHRIGSFFDIFYDVSLDGTNGMSRVIVADEAGNVVGTMDGPPVGEMLAEGTGLPSGCGKQAVEIGGVRTACLWWDWSSDMHFTRPGLPPLTGRQIRVLAAQPTVPFDYMHGVTIHASGMQELDVLNQRYTGHGSGGGGGGCFADYNQDGGIDGADVEMFFADWEQGLPGSDVNQDGGIDGADVELFFQEWEAGGCG